MIHTMAISAERKAAMLSMEVGGMMKSINTEKAYQQETVRYGINSCTVYKGAGDGAAAQKVECVRNALKALDDRNIMVPSELRFYCCSNGDKVQNRAFTRDASWNPVSYITLSPSSIVQSNVQSVSNSVHPGFDKGTVTCIHEIGHTLHAQKMGDKFLDTNANGGCTGLPTALASQVSGYAAGSKKEFVAETFAGMVLGRQYSQAVMAEYNSYNGPEMPDAWVI